MRVRLSPRALVPKKAINSDLRIMKIKQFLILIALVAGVVIVITAFRAAWVLFSNEINCSPRELSVSSSVQGATGGLAGLVSITNISTSSCYLTTPSFFLSLSDSNNTPLDVKILSSLLPSGKDFLRPNASSSFLVVWRNWCGSPINQPVDPVNPSSAGSPHGVNLELHLTGFPSPIISPLKNVGGTPVTGGPRCDDPQSSSTLSIQSAQ